jgi:MFS family permease
VFIGEVPTGLLADRFGQKISIVFGYLVEALGIALIVVYPTAIGLYLAGCIRGIGSSFLSGSEEALLYESVRASGQNNFQKVYGRFISNEHVGYIGSTVVAGLAYQFFGAQAFVPLIVLTTACIAGAALLSLMLTDLRAQSQDTALGSGMFSVLRESMSLIRHNDIIFTLTIVGILTMSGEYFIQSVYQPYFALHGVPAFWMGAVLSVGTVVSIITSRYAFLLERYLTLEKILLVVNLTLGGLYVCMALVVHPVFLVSAYALMNGLFNVQVPIVSDYINNRTSSAIRSTVLSGVSFFRRFFQTFLLWGLSIAVATTGTQASLMIQGAYLIVGVLIGYYLLVRCGCTYKVSNTEGEALEF